jgi:aspartate-semialdehyde dehydrogenase
MAERAPTVAVVGATGLVGQEILAVLAERQFPLADVRAISSSASEGSRVSFAEQELRVGALSQDVLRGAGVVFFAAGSDVSSRYAPAAAAGGAVVIDTSGCFAEDQAVPLVVPEVNARILSPSSATRLVAVAGGAAAALAAVLKPLDEAAGVRSVSAATYEPASRMGQRGVSELGRQTVALLNGRSANEAELESRLAFNCIPAIGDIDSDGYSTAERALALSLRRVLDLPELQVVATAVQVPIFFGLGVTAVVETERPLGAADALAVLREAPGILLAGEEQPYAALLDVVGSDAIHVGRIRGTPARPTSLCIWAAIDNVRKAGALNAVTIAERMLR